jgi:hypothetical protein
MQPCAGPRHFGGDPSPGVVVTERREEVDLRVAPHELRERDAASTAGEPSGVVHVDDLSRARHRRHAPDGDVLDVADHRDPERPLPGLPFHAAILVLLAYFVRLLRIATAQK